MDVPVSLLEWELFLPQQYQVKDFAGDATSANLMQLVQAEATDSDITFISHAPVSGEAMLPGQIGGLVLDRSGAPIRGALVSLTFGPPAPNVPLATTTDANGRWLLNDVPSGNVTISVQSPGFQSYRRSQPYDARFPFQNDITLVVGSVSLQVETSSSSVVMMNEKDRGESKNKAPLPAPPPPPASSNVQNLQRRVSGVLPINIDVPKTGRSFRFIRPLVLDEETKITFTYKTGK